MVTENHVGEKGTSALTQCLEHNTSLTNLTTDTPTHCGANVLGVLLAKNLQLQYYKKIAVDLKRQNDQLTMKVTELQQKNST